MSNLDYPIRILVMELSKLTTLHPVSAKGMEGKVGKLNGANRAICILREYKHRDEEEERKKMKKKITNDKNIKL